MFIISKLANHALRQLVIVVAALMLFSVVAPNTASAQVKVGFVDLQRSLNKVDEGKKAKARLKKQFDKKQKDLNKKQEDLKKIKENFEANAMMLSPDAKRQKAMEFQMKLGELQQIYMKHQEELAKAEAKATKEIFDKMGKIIESIAKEKGYTLVLERSESAILFAKDDMDLTNELIKRYNAKY